MLYLYIFSWVIMIIKKRLVVLLLSIVFTLILTFSVSAISVTLSELYGSDTYRIFDLVIANNDTSSLNNVNWTFDTDNSNTIAANQLVNLNVNENVSVYIAYNYSTRGQFTINATAFNETLKDSEILSITVSDLVVTEFDKIYLNQTEFIIEIIANNTGLNALTNINWTLNMNDSNIIKANSLFNLNSGENILIYVEYNYSSIGKYNVTARTFDSLNDYSTTSTFKTNSTPVISPVPDVTFKEDSFNDTINLNNYITDEDSGSDLIWIATGNSSTTVRIEFLSNGIVNISGALNYNNYPPPAVPVNITLVVTDTDGLSDNDTLLVTVIRQNDPPNITRYTPEN